MLGMPCPDGVSWPPHLEAGRWAACAVLRVLGSPNHRSDLGLNGDQRTTPPGVCQSGLIWLPCRPCAGRGRLGRQALRFRRRQAMGPRALAWAAALPGSNGRLACYGFSLQAPLQPSSCCDDPHDPGPIAWSRAMLASMNRLPRASDGRPPIVWASWPGLGLQLTPKTVRRRG